MMVPAAPPAPSDTRPARVATTRPMATAISGLTCRCFAFAAVRGILSALLASFPLLAQEVLEVLHQLSRVELAVRERLPLFGSLCIVLLLQFPHVLSGGAIPSHRPITLGIEVLDGLGEMRHVRTQVEQAGNIAHQRLDRGRIFSILQIVRRLSHEADMPHSQSLCSVQ